MIDAILFPVDADEPRIIKLPCMVQHDDDAEIATYSIVHRWDDTKDLYYDKQPRSVRPFTPGRGYFTCLQPSNGYQLEFFYDDDAFVNGSRLNRCVQALSRGTSPHPWCGNLIGVRSERPTTHCIRYYNASMREDLPRLLDAILRYGTDSYKTERDSDDKWGGSMEELEY